MALKESVGDNMSMDFDTITLGPEEAEPGEAELKVRLQTAGRRYGVLVFEAADGSHMAVRMFDVTKGRFSPLKTGLNTDMNDIIETEEMLSQINDTEAPGIIIVEEGNVVGVLSEEKLREYFDKLDLTVHTRLQSDSGLHGKPTVEPYRVICAKTGCGALNILDDEFDEGRTMCVNGHILEAP